MSNALLEGKMLVGGDDILPNYPVITGLVHNANILPGKLTCPLKMNGWKMYFLLK